MVILMEYIALLDFVGDLFLLVALLGSKHTAWTILSVFTMICPYIISYIPLINFQIQRYSFITQDQSKRLRKECKRSGSRGLDRNDKAAVLRHRFDHCVCRRASSWHQILAHL